MPFNPSQPREKSGPHGGWWVFSGARIDAAMHKAAGLPYGNMIQKISEDEGFSYSLDGKEPKGGYMVSTGGKGNEFKVPVKELTQLQVAEYVAANLQPLMRRAMYVGGWLDNGRACLDVSRHLMNFEQAVSLAIANHQDAIFNLNTFQSMYYNEVTNTYEYKD
jgi:hypothetical protein